MAKRGRPKPDFEAVAILLRLHPDTVAAIDKHRGDLPRNRWVSWLVMAWLADQMPKLSPERVHQVMTELNDKASAEEAARKARATKTPAKPKKAASEAPVAAKPINRLGPALKGTRPVTGFDPVTNEPIYGPKR